MDSFPLSGAPARYTRDVRLQYAVRIVRERHGLDEELLHPQHLANKPENLQNKLRPVVG